MDEPRGNWRLFLGPAGLVIFIVAWEGISRYVVHSNFLPDPSEILAEAWRMSVSGMILPHLLSSMKNFLLGMVIALLIGLPMGLLMGWYRTLGDLCDLVISAIYTTPLVALTPTVILVFGIYDPSKVFMTFLAAVFPILINTAHGVRTTDPKLIIMAKSLTVSDFKLFITVVLPSTIPYIISGFRLAVGRGLVFIVVVEMLASNKGLGFLAVSLGDQFDLARMFVPVLIIAGLGILFVGMIKRVESRFEKWR